MLFSEPVVAAFSLWLAFAWGVLFGLFESVPYVFTNVYGFTEEQVSYTLSTLSYVLPAGVSKSSRLPVHLSHCRIGPVIGFLANFGQDRLYRKNFPTKGPEARLYGACVAGILFPAACFMYAWTASVCIIPAGLALMLHLASV